MTDFHKFLGAVGCALWLALGGSFAGGMLMKNTEDGIYLGALLGGALPAAVAAWFLFLHMRGEKRPPDRRDDDA
jgi:hypothetical protein